MSNKGLARQAVSGHVSYQFKNYNKVVEAVGAAKAEDMFLSLQRGQKVKLPLLTRIKESRPDDDLWPEWFFIVMVFSAVISLFGTAALVGYLTNSVLIASISAIVTTVVTCLGMVRIPTFIELGIEKAPLAYNLEELVETAEEAVNRLNKSEVWRDKKNYPDVERFDTKEILNNIRTMADTVNFEYQNQPVDTLTDPENYKEFKSVVENLEATSHLMDKIFEKTRELERANEEAEITRVTLDNRSSLIVESALKNNKVRVDGLESAIQDTLAPVREAKALLSRNA